MSAPKSLTARQLGAMTKEEVIAYVEAGGSLADVIRTGTRGATSGPTPEIPTIEEESMKVTSFRLPEAMVRRLDQVAGNDKEGRSGIVRLAVADYLKRHGPYVDIHGNLIA